MDQKSRNDLDAALSNLNRNLQAYFAGDPYAYLHVATDLRKLLCDDGRSDDNSLTLRIHPQFSLHSLRKPSLPIDGPNVFLLPGRMTFDGRAAGHLSASLFDEQLAVLPLAEWRSQRLMSEKITIREFIRSIADKEAAHSDRRGGNILPALKSLHIGNRNSAAEYLSAIGHYVLRSLLLNIVSEMQSEMLAEYRSRRADGPGALLLRLANVPRPLRKVCTTSAPLARCETVTA